MSERILRFDWSKTPLGPIERWPQSLRTTVSLCLASNFPINIVWGPEHTQIYNDSYRDCCGDAHPRALGEDYSVTWASAWPAIGDSFERALSGEAMYLQDRRMFLKRLNGALEETFFTFSHSPIRDESGEIGGLFHPVTETTANMLAERRTRALRDLSAGLGAALDEAGVARRTVEVLSQFDFDLPFLLFYRGDSKSGAFHLADQYGLASGTGAAPPELSAKVDSPWQIDKVLAGLHIVEVDGLASHFHGRSCGPYEEPPDRAFVLPIVVPGAERPPALVIAGASSRLPMTEAYRGFYHLLGVTISGALATVRALEDERRRAEALAEIDRAKTAFFSNVSHEFRTPLTLMLGPLEEVLAMSNGADHPERPLVDVAHRNGVRLLKLVNTLLDFTRIEAHRVQANYEPTDLSAFTAELASVFRSATEKAGLELCVECDPLAEPAYIDREMWERIVLNLVSNAFKFTFQGSIQVRLRETGDAFELAVKDSGVGIPQSELPRIFERFHRVEGSQGRSFEGSGIGLSLVQELVKLHGGTIVAHSEVNKGSTFLVSIPKGKLHLPQDRIQDRGHQASTGLRAQNYANEAMRWLSTSALDSGTQSPAAASSEPLSNNSFPARAAGATVLLADDNADMRDYVRRLLEQSYHVVEVNNGKEALDALAVTKPDLILADVMMPVLDGFGLLNAVRANPDTRGIPFIMLTARAGEESRVEGLRAGADDYLVKPFTARQLLARIDSQLSLSIFRRQAENAMRESAVWLNGQKKAFQAAVNGAPLAESLGILVRTAIDQLGNGARCAFYLADVDRTELHHVVGATDSYARDVDGFRIGPETVACGLAMHTGQPVITPDVTQDPRWNPWASLAKKHDYRACWSFPIESSAGKMIGTFAVYSSEPRDAAPRDHELAAVLTHAASIIISRYQEVEERVRAERVRAERVLRESEERFRALVSATSNVVYRMNSDWSEMEYLEGRDFIPDTTHPSRSWIEEYIPPEDQADVMEAIDQAIRTRSNFEMEHRVIRSDGSIGWTSSCAVPIIGDCGEIIEWFGAAADITRRKLAEDALLKSEKLAAMGRLAGMIAHEINNPLEAVGNLTYLLGSQPSLDGDARNLVRTLDQELSRVAHITKQSLGFYRESSKPVSVSLSTVLDDVLDVLAHKVEKNRVRVERNYRTQGVLFSYPGEMRQVFLNLISNAVEAMPRGGRLRVHLHQSQNRPDDSDGGFRISIADTGTGVSPEVARKIWEPFFTTKEEKGTGLGLWVTQGIVQKHEGSIRFRTLRRNGSSTTCFSVFFPARRLAVMTESSPGNQLAPGYTA